MRTIKFQVWSKRYRQMHDVMLISCDVDSKINALRVVGKGGCIELVTDDFGQYELREFTGLLDKHGREIFEGDIIKSAYLRPHDAKTGVVSLAPGASFFTWKNGEEVAALARLSSNMIEVIGNIYENRELLEANK